jgi:[acyl-carrier-protein] S-malonyltransferase
LTTAMVFPGQGAQAPGLGLPWRATEAWEVVERAEAVLGRPIEPLLLRATAEDLARTREAQLAVFLASVVAWEAVRGALPEPVAVAGHSLGQLTALVAAGVLELEDAVTLVDRRGELTQAAADRAPGRMAALLGATTEQADDACNAAPGGCWVANDNGPGQIVIAGEPAAIDAAIAAAKDAGVRRAVALDVSGAFHTPLMEPARAEFVRVLADVAFRPAAIPVVANDDATPVTDPAEWPRRLADHLVGPVRWRESMETLVALGVTRAVEVGPGGVLAGLFRRGAPSIDVRTVDKPDDIPALAGVSR